MITYKEYLLQHLLEAESSGVAFTFGRMNPITKGHEENIKELQKIAKDNKLIPIIYTSFSQDNKKNPLNFKDKIKYIKKFFKRGNTQVSVNPKLKNAFQILEELAKTHKKIYFIVGEDRISDFKSMEKYAKEYGVTDFKIIESGKRTSGISGTKMREFAKNDDFDSFKKNLPSSAIESDAEDLFEKVKEGLQ